MKVMIVNVTVPFEQLDEELLAEKLHEELLKVGKVAELIRLPFDGYHRDLPGQMLALSLLDVASWADCVITIGVPGWAVDHPNKRVWFFSHHRPLYELWNTPWGLLYSPHTNLMRRAIIEADRTCIAKARKVFSASITASRQLQDYHRINSEVLFPPIVASRQAALENYGDYIYTDGYFSEEMRHDLIIRAMQKTQSAVRLVIGTRSGRLEYREYLDQLASQLSVSDKVTFLSPELNSEERLAVIAHARACAYVPYSSNWWGLFATEAYCCGRAVVTCTDSDGVKELVQPGQGGLVVSPDADALGQAFDKLYNDRDLAAQLGDEAYRAINRLIPDWGYVVERLLG